MVLLVLSVLAFFSVPSVSNHGLIKWNRRPTTLQDCARDSDDEDYQDRDYDVAALANNLSQAFQYDIYNNNNINEVVV